MYACGYQTRGAIITAIAYWPIGITIAAILAFKVDMGLSGLWIGPINAAFIVMTSFVMIIRFTNWKKLIKNAAVQRDADASATVLYENNFKAM
jgi:Na+-driven multidrug efflux pump